MSKQVCVLVSGGQDSTVAYHLAVYLYGVDNVVAVYVNIDQPYVTKEKLALNALDIPYVEIKADLCKIMAAFMPTPEKQEIFGRNLLLAFYGGLMAPTVWISALENELYAGDPDKSYAFMHQASAVLSMVFTHKQRETIVTTPFKHLTKSDVVRLGIHGNLGLSPEYLLKTTSCYSTGHGSCGECLACVKRWISWTNNGITEEFRSVPYETSYLYQLLPKLAMGDSRYSIKRVFETHRAMRSVGMPGVSYPTGGYSLEDDLLSIEENIERLLNGDFR